MSPAKTGEKPKIGISKTQFLLSWIYNIYEPFSLQPAHPCFKIDHVGASGKFSYMFPVYMVITSENKKII